MITIKPPKKVPNEPAIVFRAMVEYLKYEKPQCTASHVLVATKMLDEYAVWHHAPGSHPWQPHKLETCTRPGNTIRSIVICMLHPFRHRQAKVIPRSVIDVFRSGASFARKHGAVLSKIHAFGKVVRILLQSKQYQPRIRAIMQQSKRLTSIHGTTGLDQ